jgi:sugar/nucleoside kinase (ribokinase family)
MQKWDIMTFGDLCVDFIMHAKDATPEFGQKEKMMDSYGMLMGGSTGIFGCQCAKLGLKTAVVGRVGEDVFGKLILDELQNCGVDSEFVTPCKQVNTGLTCILQSENDRAMLTVLGSMGAAQFTDAPPALRQNVRHVHIGSYYLMDQLRSGYPEFLRELRGNGATVSLDTNWDPSETWDGLDEMATLVDVFIPNENEVRGITGEQDVMQGLAVLAQRFPVVAAKLGDKGAAAMAGGQVYTADALKVPFVDAVGAGDSFDGGFLYGWLGGKPLGDCLRAACYCGSMNVTCRGGTAGQPTRTTLPENLR